MIHEIQVLDHGYVRLHNIASMVRRPELEFDAISTDPALVARVSFNNLLKEESKEKDMGLVNYLQTNFHTTPIEFTTVWLEFKMPLFVARQFDTVRTRSKNELSGRYKELPRQWYLPEIARGKPSGSIKQGSGASMDENDTQWLRHTLDYQCTRAWDNYDAAIERGIAPELARMYLSLNNYTIFAYKQDLHNLTNNFLRLRLDKHAQWETRQYAIAIHDLLKQVLPEWMELWDAQQEQKERDKRELAVLRTVVVNQQEQLERLKRASVLANCGTGEETI